MMPLPVKRPANASGYITGAVHFNNNTDTTLLRRGAKLTGVGDTFTYIESKWVKNAIAEGTLAATYPGFHFFDEMQGGDIHTDLFDATEAFSVTFSRNPPPSLSIGSWTHFLRAVNLTDGISNFDQAHLQILINGIMVPADKFGQSGGPEAAFTIGFSNENNFLISGDTPTQGGYDGDMAEYYFAPGQFLDFTNIVNVRKFISAANKPVNLGTNGELPTGVAPAIYMRGNASTFATNLGTGGAFATVGTLTNATTSPSD